MCACERQMTLFMYVIAATGFVIGFGDERAAKAGHCVVGGDIWQRVRLSGVTSTLTHTRPTIKPYAANGSDSLAAWVISSQRSETE